MQISNLKTLAIPSLNDVLPILDINGGVSGKPILKKATLSSLFALIEPSESNSGFTVPTIIKTVAASGDYFIGIDSEGIPYKIKISDLLAGLSTGGNSSGSGGSGTSSDIVLDWSSNGDTKGLFYYLGTNAKTTAWNNPTGNGVIISASTTENGSLSSLVDRSSSEWYSNIAPNNYVQFQITTCKLKCSRYSIRTRANNVDYYPRNWQFQGSNDGINWNILDEQVNNTTLTSISQWLTLPISTATAYSYFRLLQNGVDSSGVGYLCLGEVELYGVLVNG